MGYLPFGKGLDKNNCPIIGSIWDFPELAQKNLQVIAIEERSLVVHCKQMESGCSWTASLGVLRKGHYKLVSIPMDREPQLNNWMGVKDGRPIKGSVWHDPNDSSGDYKIYKNEIQPAFGPDGVFLSRRAPGQKEWTEGGFGWQANRIISEWNLIELPEGYIVPTPAGTEEEQKRKEQGLPVLRKILREDPIVFEKLMQQAEKDGKFQVAKSKAEAARYAHALNNSLLVEERAVEEKRIVHKDYLKTLGIPDRRCYEIRGLHEFKHYDVQMKGWLWFEK